MSHLATEIGKETDSDSRSSTGHQQYRDLSHLGGPFRGTFDQLSERIIPGQRTRFKAQPLTRILFNGCGFTVCTICPESTPWPTPTVACLWTELSYVIPSLAPSQDVLPRMVSVILSLISWPGRCAAGYSAMAGRHRTFEAGARRESILHVSVKVTSSCKQQ